MGAVAADPTPDHQSASRLLSEGAFEAAAAAFAALRVESPLDSDLPAFQTMALAQLGRLDEAEAVIAPALNLRLKNIVPLVIAAEVATLRSDWLVAALRWRCVAAGNPRSYTRWMRFEAQAEPATPWLRHVEALYRDGRDAEAEAAWAKAVALHPDSLALLRLPADIATERGDHELAGKHWTAALERSGRHPAMVGAAVAAAWRAGPMLRASPEARVAEGGYFAPSAEVQAWNDRLRAEAPLLCDRVMDPVASIEVVHGALVMPHMPQPSDAPARLARMMRGGAFDANGRILVNGIQLGRSHVPDAPCGPLAAFEPLPGRWIFASARIYGHIGHFLMEALGRLWAADCIGGRVDGLLSLNSYHPTLDANGFDFRSLERRSHVMTKPSGYVASLLRIFGGITNHHVATAPVRVEELYVPSQLLALRPSDAASHPGFRAFARRSVQAICEAPGPATPERVYISRTRLRADRGPLFQEEALERCLEAQGYTIIYPETLSVEEQLRLYWNATYIIIATGTAAHIAAMAMRGHQRVALLKRNPGQDRFFDEQLRAFGAVKVVWIDAVTGHFEDRAPGGRRYRDYGAPHALDTDRAMAALHEAGFVSDASPRPDAAAEAEAMAQFLERLRRFAPDSAYVFVPRQI